jgi:hypothetical protein
MDCRMAGTSATLLARKWESALLVNVDNDTLRRILDNPEAMAAVERIEGWRALGDNIIETIINKSDLVKNLKNKAKEKELSKKEQKQLTEEEREYKSKRKLIQEKLIKFATRIPAFMYLTDFRENTLKDVITKIEPDLFQTVTGLTVKDFHLLVSLKVFNTEQMDRHLLKTPARHPMKRRIAESAVSRIWIRAVFQQNLHRCYGKTGLNRKQQWRPI